MNNSTSDSSFSEIEYISLCTEAELNLYCAESLSVSDNDDNSRIDFRRCGNDGISFTKSIRTGLDRFVINTRSDDNFEDNAEFNNPRKRFRNEEASSANHGSDEEGDQESETRKNCTQHSNFLREINRVNKRTRVLHDIIYFENIAKFHEEFSNCLERKRRLNIFICAVHSDHIHLVHDCSYTEGRCRCTIVKSLRARRIARSRRAAWHWEFDERR